VIQPQKKQTNNKSFHLPQKQFILALLLVWLAWFVVNLAANGLFYIAADNKPSLRLPGEVLYFAGISIVGVVVPYHLCRRWHLDIPLLPEKRTIWFWLASLIFFVLAVPLGLAAMSDQGMTWAMVWERPFPWIIAPVPLFIPTMIAYTLLWYGLMLRGWERIFGGTRWGTMAAVVVTAVLYGVYHFASVDELKTLTAVLDEIMITTLIGIGFGLYVVWFRSLLVAFMANWLLNWFVFMPLDTFHPPAWRWPVGLLVLLIVWGIYRFAWLSKN
jgi:membrane protease YdiL (CAAX protease family)